ncbi:Protease 2 [Candidatus Providencia siddallii]|uniref:Protease 2 n=1 Tax=Candidatus Providencia siddallii TaxID=1715285 RepID=A0A0M6WA21_9GAMM|nr:Protease 2 [Candidatus Providencia siddallii]
MKPPQLKKIPYKINKHNDIRIDNYYWLRNDGKKSSKVINYLIKENRYSRKMLKGANFFRKEIYNEFLSRMKQNDTSIPYNYNGYSYRIRVVKNSNYLIYERRVIGSDSDWVVLINGNERAKKTKYYNIGMLTVSPDNSIIAITEDKIGQNIYTVSFYKINDVEWRNDVLINTSGDIEWANNSKTLLYINKNNQTLLPYQVFSHQYGECQKQDNLLYEEKDDTYCVDLMKSRSKDYIFICINNINTSEYRLFNANNIKSPIVIFKTRKIGFEYYINHFENKFYIRSNHQNQLFGLYIIDSNDINHDNFMFWKKLVEPRVDVDLERFELFTEWLVLEERVNGLINIRQINFQTKKENFINFDDSIYDVHIIDNYEQNTNKLRYIYSSLTTPYSIYEIDMNTQEKKILKQEEVNLFNKEDYKSERLWITASDGVKIPVSLVYRKDLFNFFKNPLLIYGYGAYGHSVDISFDFTKISLLNRGFVYAISHIRGGGDLGKKWYLDGKAFNKKNTFNDFIDTTKALIKLGYCKSTNIYAIGASAGGLLMGVIANVAPELYKGIVISVPFVDVLTTMMDSSIPLTTLEYDEWGNPEDKNFYYYIKSYSPYDNIKPQRYPNMLVTTGLHDSQVQYWEPVKWVAKLRSMKHNDSILLLKVNMNSGHTGKSGRLRSLDDIAFCYAFILMLENKK